MNKVEDVAMKKRSLDRKSYVIKRIQDMRLLDDNLMSLVFSDNIPAVQLVLRIILGKYDLCVVDVRTEDEHLAVGKRSVIFDVRAVDSIGAVYDIEVQRADRGAGVRRARYNASLLDTRLLEVGEEDFNKLPDKYVIFITENDVMKQGRALYSYVFTEETTHEPLNDGSHIIYVNGAYENDGSDIGKLMHDFRCADPRQMNFDRLATDVDYFKNGGGQPKMCRIVEELCNEARYEQIEIGVLNHIKNGFKDIAQIATLLGTTTDIVEQILTKNNIRI